MKKILAAILILTAIGASAQTPQELMLRANNAYSQGHFAEAVDCYNAVLNAGYQSADLYYNLGNAHYRLDEYGLAILNYERALRLKPNFRDARQNLDLANSKTEEEIPPLPEIFLAQWAHKVVSWFSPTGWRILFLCLGAALLAYAQQTGFDLPTAVNSKGEVYVVADKIFPSIAFSLSGFTAIVFVLGMVAAGYSSADGTLTALTTTFCYNFLHFGRHEDDCEKVGINLVFSEFCPIFTASFHLSSVSTSIVQGIYRFSASALPAKSARPRPSRTTLRCA